MLFRVNYQLYLIKMMQGISLFLSIHGADTVNSHFLNAGTPVIELQSTTLISPLYRRCPVATILCASL